MKGDTKTLAEIFDTTVQTIAAWIRAGMPRDVTGAVRWVRARDAARTLPPKRSEREPRADRAARRDALRELWLPRDCLIPWQHSDVVPIDEFQRGAGIAGTGELIDLIALGLPLVQPAANGSKASKLGRVSLPHAAQWRSLLGLAVGCCGGDAKTWFLGREMRRLCGLPPAADDAGVPVE